MSTPEVVVYGASGYTGKLIAWQLAERGIPFIAAGRNQKRLEEQMAKVPELANADYQCVAVAHDQAALAKLFAGKRVVYNVVGPFIQYGEPVVKACLDAGVHYLDPTGEQDWIMILKEKYHGAFKAKGLLLCPANAWMWTAGQLAAELALETEGVDTLDIAYMADSNTSVASTQSFLRMCTRDQYYLKNQAFEVWPHIETYPLVLPGDHRVYNSLPWSGGAEPVWYHGDQRVRNCSVLVTFKNQAVMGWVIGRIKDWHDNCRNLPRAEQTKRIDEWAHGMVNTEPERENPDLNRSIISCHGRGNIKSVTVVLRGNSPYIQAGLFAAESVRRILIGRLYASGFASPCKAFGHHELLASAAEDGYLTWEKTSV